MNEESPNDYLRAVGGAEALAHALHIEECEPDLQIRIMGAFSNLLFKRVLLSIPEEHVELTKRIIAETHENGGDVGAVLSALSSAIPGTEDCLTKETERLIAEFSRKV